MKNTLTFAAYTVLLDQVTNADSPFVKNQLRNMLVVLPDGGTGFADGVTEADLAAAYYGRVAGFKVYNTPGGEEDAQDVMCLRCAYPGPGKMALWQSIVADSEEVTQESADEYGDFCVICGNALYTEWLAEEIDPPFDFGQDDPRGRETSLLKGIWFTVAHRDLMVLG